jgi:pimeloyl-ACP methyl ester carboxylesterase
MNQRQARRADGPAALRGPITSESLGNGYFLHRFIRPDGSEAVVYGNRERLDCGPALPIVVAITGSGCASVFPRPAGRTGSEQLPGRLLSAAGDGYGIFFLEKRGVSPLDPGCGGSAENGSEEYHAHATRRSRIAEQRLLLNAICDRASVDRGRLALVGYSEGASVAAALAREEPGLVTHVALLSGGGPTQMLELVSLVRAGGGRRSAEETEAEVGRYMETFRRILGEDGDDDRALFLGHRFGRWRGFLSQALLEDLLALRIPIFVGHGTSDQAVPVLSADLIEVEFIRHRKENLTIRRYPGLDHGFGRGEGPGRVEEMARVIGDLLAWLEGR